MISSTKLPLKVGLFCLFSLIGFNNYASFIKEQMQYSRVKRAYQEKEPLITKKLSVMELKTDNVQLLIRVFKQEQTVNIYVKKSDTKVWKVYQELKFNCTSGDLGPKRREGDYQIPEGFYHINHFNPYSSFELSLGVSYPNVADRIKSSHKSLGGNIYMHGGCATIGCIPIEDEPIKELYILAAFAKSNGQSNIPIQIFPFEYSKENLNKAIQVWPQHEEFWKNLFEVDASFRQSKYLKEIKVKANGDYYSV